MLDEAEAWIFNLRLFLFSQRRNAAKKKKLIYKRRVLAPLRESSAFFQHPVYSTMMFPIHGEGVKFRITIQIAITFLSRRYFYL